METDTRATGELSGSGYWLAVGGGGGDPMGEALTAQRADGERALAVFGSEEAARAFLNSAAREGWQLRESGVGELLSLLYGPLSGVERVVPNPSSGEDFSTASMGRRSFVDALLSGGRSWFERWHSRREGGAATSAPLALKAPGS